MPDIVGHTEVLLSLLSRHNGDDSEHQASWNQREHLDCFQTFAPHSDLVCLTSRSQAGLIFIDCRSPTALQIASRQPSLKVKAHHSAFLVYFPLQLQHLSRPECLVTLSSIAIWRHIRR